jgi:hypothetical protein
MACTVTNLRLIKLAKSHAAMLYGGWRVKRTEVCIGGGDKSTRIANNMYLNKQNQINIEIVNSNQNL